MSKGDIGEKTPFIVAAVIFFVIVVFVIFQFFPDLMQQIGIAWGVIQLSNIEQAILCSYHRCIDGCMSMKVQEISWKETDKTISCQKFCEDPNYNYEGNVLKVCKSDYPVTIELKKGEKIEKSHLTLGSTTVSDVRCILSSEAGGPDAWDVVRGIAGTIWTNLVNAWTALTGGTISDNFLTINSGLIKSYGGKEDCVPVGTGIVLSHDSLKELLIKDNQKISITTQFSSFGPFNSVATSVYKGE